MKNALYPLIMTAWLSLSATSLWAQGTLQDPTRPPEKTAISRSVTPVTGAVSGPESSDAAKPAAENIQMLVIGRQRAFALIDGALVKPGDSLNQWQLVSIHRQSVVMRNAAVTQEISISPSVVKTIRTSSRTSSSHDSVVNKPSRNSP